MSRTLFSAMAVALSACMPVMNGAWAESATESVRHYGNGCSASNRVSHSDSTCITATWNNAEGTFSVTSHCASYGSIVAHIIEDTPTEPTVGQSLDASTWQTGLRNRHVHLQSSGSSSGIGVTASSSTIAAPSPNTNASTTVSGTDSDREITEISCCADVSDLCYRGEVEATGGSIQRRTSGTTYTDEDVATHAERYAFCQQYPSNIYCRVNPSGDALTAPLVIDPNLQTCYDNWATSPAASSCTDFHADGTTSISSYSSTTAEQRRAVALYRDSCHNVSATCGGNSFEIDNPVPVGDVATIHWCSPVSYRHCTWNADQETYETQDFETTAASLVVGDNCTLSDPYTEWQGGPAIDTGEDGIFDCSDYR